MQKTLLSSLLGILAITAFPVSAEVYRWVDKDGKVFYSDKPPLNTQAEEKKLTRNKVDTGELPYETRRAAEQAPVVLYVSPDCKELCEGARELLKKRKIPFTEKSMTTAEDIDKLLKLTTKKEPSVPVLTVGSKVLDGFESTSWNSTLDTAGYPK